MRGECPSRIRGESLRFAQAPHYGVDSIHIPPEERVRWNRCKLDVITAHRLKMLELGPDRLEGHSEAERAQMIYGCFLERVPYENLSNNRAVQSCVDDPENWPRTTDRLLRENVAYGLGGTSFSLAYALRDLMRGAGLTAHCTLGYNLVTEQAHAAVVLYVDEGPLLYDPALLMCGPVPVRPGGTLNDPLGQICLESRCGPTLSVTLKMHCGLREPQPGEQVWPTPLGPSGERTIYSIIPVPAPPQSYRQAWLASFYRGRPMPLRFARRINGAIYRYGERPGSIDVLRADSRDEIRMDADPIAQLHEIFGIDEGCLREWFAK